MTDVIHLHAQKLVTYKGDYDTFEKTRSERVRNQQKAIEANERTRAQCRYTLKKITIHRLGICQSLFGN